MKALTAALTTILVSSTILISTFGQETNRTNFGEPHLSPDETPTRGEGCEDLFARIDNLLINVSQISGARGFVVIYEDAAARNAGARREWQVKAHLRRHGAAAMGISVIRGPVRKVAMTQLWLVRAGEADPALLPADAEFVGTTTENPYMFATERVEMAKLGCDPPLDVDGFANTLRANEGERGNIVIGESTPARFRAKERKLLAELSKQGVARAQIKAVHKRVRPNAMEEYVELWIVPPSGTAKRSSGRPTVIGNSEAEATIDKSPGVPPAQAADPLPPPPPPPPPPKKAEGNTVSGGVLNGKAISLPKPIIPAEAIASKASGAVVVEVIVDEEGNVISAKAISGHETLRVACEAAARQAKFSPTLAGGKAVKVGGRIVYNFVN